MFYLTFKLQKQNMVPISLFLSVTYHRLALSTMTPLSMEKASVGKPAMFQARIFIGSPRVLLSEKSVEQEIPLL